ncbi:MAG: 4Fe-4S dicluster domain-containing protein [gamma proteobacterium symbiont of Bathyaustriella thionipta]|nr:4Fe-4S dicluster domain-containing protein [gamma proteobacterium symbiont of Bathyaustriella thionipta]
MADKNNLLANKARRSFLGKAAAAASLTVAPGVVLQSIAAVKSGTEGVSDNTRWGMLIDTSKCADGCDACVTACASENGLPVHERPKSDPVWIRKVKLKDNLTDSVTTLPMMCQHCEKPPCADVCPTGASFRRADGIVMVDRHICIGCRYCMMACPYKARSFIHEEIVLKPTHTPRGKGCVESCNFCVHRLDSGNETTACQEACQKEGHNAIIFGDLKDSSSEVSQALRNLPSREIRADLQLNTGVRYKDI